MKIVSLIIGLLVYSSAFASTINVNRAEDIITILKSDDVRFLISQEDGVGLFEGISFVPSITEGSNYEIRFSSYFGLDVATCVAPVEVIGVNVSVGKVTCDMKKAPAPPENICSNPSPTGCLDK